MAYCGPRGIPRAIFLGRVVGAGEPAWLSDDFDAAMEWMEAEANKCPGCGMFRDECMSDEPPDYVATPIVCHACMERDVRADQHAKGGGSRAGVYFVTEQEGASDGS